MAASTVLATQRQDATTCQFSFGSQSPASDIPALTWAVNDVRFNTAHGSNIIYWRCTVAGSPGTWEAVLGTLTALTGPAVVYTDSSGNLQTDTGHFYYAPAAGAGAAATFVVGDGTTGVNQGVAARFIATIGGTLPGLSAQGAVSGVNPLLTGQPLFTLDNAGGDTSGIAFRQTGVTHSGLIATNEGNWGISVPDFLSLGAGHGGLSIFKDLAQTQRVALFDVQGAHGSVTADSLAGATTELVKTSTTGLLSRATAGTDYQAALNLTAGSVLFSGGGAVVSQDNSNFFWNNTSKTLEVGLNNTTITEAVSHFYRSSAGATTHLVTNDNTSGLAGFRATLSKTSVANDYLGFFMFGSAFTSSGLLGPRVALLEAAPAAAANFVVSSLSAGSLVFATSGSRTNRASIDASGNFTIVNLGGGGTTQMVTATTAGLLGVQAIPTGATPGGSNRQVQFNNSGAFGGALALEYDSASQVVRSLTALDLAGDLRSAQSTLSLSGQVNNYTNSTAVVLLSASVVGPRLTGITAPAATYGGSTSKLLFLMNDTTNTVVLANQDAGSTAANRFGFTTGNDVILGPGGGCLVVYDSVAARWRQVSQTSIPPVNRTLEFSMQGSFGCVGPAGGGLWLPTCGGDELAADQGTRLRSVPIEKAVPFPGHFLALGAKVGVTCYVPTGFNTCAGTVIVNLTNNGTVVGVVHTYGAGADGLFSSSFTVDGTTIPAFGISNTYGIKLTGTTVGTGDLRLFVTVDVQLDGYTI